MYGQDLMGNGSIIPKAYNYNTLEGNWYEDRCVSEYDKEKKKGFALSNPNSWQYETTYSKIGQANKEYPTVKERFSISNDNYINFQGKQNNMHLTTYKHAYDPKYRETFRQPIKVTDFFKGKVAELGEHRKTWTKRPQLFETSYKSEISKTFFLKA